MNLFLEQSSESSGDRIHEVFSGLNRIVAIIFICLLIFSGCKTQQEDNLVIAASANTQFVVKELVSSFSREKGIKCDIIVGSSGKLTAQIASGAPFDIFLSANMKYPEELAEKALTLGEPIQYAQGTLVLWTFRTDTKPSIEMLNEDYIRRIAVPNPKTAPYGEAAMEALRRHGSLGQVEDKFIYGESISQSNQFITSRSVDIGFTSKSVVLSSRMEGKGQWVEVDKSLYSPIIQGMVIINRQPEKLVKSSAFAEFVLSPTGKDILEKFGFEVIK